MKEKTQALLEATDAIANVIELIILGIEQKIGNDIMKSKAIKYFNDHKYRLLFLLQHLKNRNFTDFISVIT